MQQTSSIANVFGRVLSGLTVIWLAQFGIALWFMIGQGYDRATADMIPMAGVAILPVWAWLLRAGLPELGGSRSARVGKALLHAASVYILGLILPAQIVLHALSFTSPFDELWWLLGIATGLSAILLGWAKGWARGSKAGTRGPIIVGLILLGSGASVPLWRAFVFSFFG